MSLNSEQVTGGVSISNKNVDINENILLKIDPKLLSILLKDNSTKKNIIWATDNYRSKGKPYFPSEYIKSELITGRYCHVIKPRVQKSKKEQLSRSRKKAEVFTPSWVCNAQNNLIDEQWFALKNIFNTEIDEGWIVNYDKIKFPRNSKKNWKEYVKSLRLEMACGEAPYITSRYDTVTGNYIETVDRIGFLDRKLRVVGENTQTETDWIYWATRAVKATYGYDWQGDNVLLARENILYTIIEHYEVKFKEELETNELIKFAKIITWNIWQMDGIKGVVPSSCQNKTQIQYTLFGDEILNTSCEGCNKNNIKSHNGIYCKIMDWSKQKSIRFVDLL